jgi:uncharacterized membrane protein
MGITKKRRKVMWSEAGFYSIRVGIPVAVFAVGIKLYQVEPRAGWVVSLLLFCGVMSLLLFPVELIERWLKISLVEEFAKAMRWLLPVLS